MSDGERILFEPSALEALQARAESLAQISSSETAEDEILLLLFALGDEWYAVGIENVREILQEFEVTSIPCLPPHVLGVVNIRGEIVSVTDVGKQMGLVSGGAEETTAIVVSDDSVTTAMVVDGIGDIVQIAKDAVEPPLPSVGKNQVEYVSGCVLLDGDLVGVLDIGQVLAPIGGERD